MNNIRKPIEPLPCITWNGEYYLTQAITGLPFLTKRHHITREALVPAGGHRSAKKLAFPIISKNGFKA